MTPVQINGWTVTADSETFRIFPTNKKGQTIPITRINQFLYLRNPSGAGLIVLKRFLHQKEWRWRDSLVEKTVDEVLIRKRIASTLFKGDEGKATDLMVRWVSGQELA